MVLRLGGIDVMEKGAWDHYVFEFEAYQNSTLEHKEEIFFQTYTCSKWDRPDNVRVVVNNGVRIFIYSSKYFNYIYTFSSIFDFETTNTSMSNILHNILIFFNFRYFVLLWVI